MKKISIFNTQKVVDPTVFRTTKYLNMIGSYSHYLRSRKEVYEKVAVYMDKVDDRLAELNDY